MFEDIKFMKKVKPMTRIEVVPIDKSSAWGFFDGARQGTLIVCGAKGILYIF
jgi:hypothetical protein